MIVYTLNALRTHPAAASSHYQPSADALAPASNTLTATTNAKLAQVLHGVFFEQNYTATGANTLRQLSEPLCSKRKAFSAVDDTPLQQMQSPSACDDTPLH